MTTDAAATRLVERAVLEKFRGDPVPENLYERVHVEDGVIVAVEEISDGVVVATRKRV